MFDIFNTPEMQGKFGEGLVNLVNGIALDEQIYKQCELERFIMRII